MLVKERLARWLRRFPSLRWGLRVGVRLFVPRHPVGAVGAVFNDAGQILLVKHVFRPDFPWGLPGGWVERGETPADTVRRELEEELGLKVEVKGLLLCETQGRSAQEVSPLGLGLAFYCRLASEGARPDELAQSNQAYEVLEVEWIAPTDITRRVTTFQQKAIVLGKMEFDRDQIEENLEQKLT